MAVAGAAIGLGNIWRFPYVAGENGGGLFFLLYLLFVLLLGLPVMIAEIVVGRAGRASPAISMRRLAMGNGSSKNWAKVAWLGTLTATMVLSFYSIVSGWILYFFARSVWAFCQFLFSRSPADVISVGGDTFGQLLASPWQMIGLHAVFVVMVICVSGRPIFRGIEQLNIWLMPLMYLVLAVLLLYTCELPGFSYSVDYLFAFRLADINSGVVLEAMGHAFFTLAIGACCLMAYGAYMPQQQSVVGAVMVVALLDVLVAVMVGVATFAVVFSEGLAAAQGPGLMFVTLPFALAQMPLGELILPLFFLLLVLAVWTSAVNLAEPLVMMITQLCGGSRGAGASVAGVVIFLSGLVPALSLNVWHDVQIADKSLFDVYTGFTTQIMLPVTGFLVLYFAGHVLKRAVLAEQLALGAVTLWCWQLLIRWVSPMLLFAVILARMWPMSGS